MRRRTDWGSRLGLERRDADLAAGLLVLLALAALTLSTIGRSGDYRSHGLTCFSAPPTSRALAHLLDRRTPEMKRGLFEEDSTEARAAGNSAAEIDPERDYLPAETTEPREACPGRHILGADRRGRDILLGLRLGSRTVLLPGLLAAILAIGLGTFLGISEELAPLSPVRSGARALRTTLGSLPKFVTLLVVLSVGMGAGASFLFFSLAVGILGSARVAEMVRSQILMLRQSDFIEACRELGLTTSQIAWRHIIRGVSRGLLLGEFVLTIGDAIMLEAMMAAVGWHLAGFNQATWANMVAQEFALVPSLKLWGALPPAFCLVVLMLGLHLLGAGLIRRFHLARIGG